MHTSQPPPPSALTPRTRTVIVRSLVAVGGALVVASAALSASGLHTLGVRAALNPALAWLVPVSTDGLICAGLLAGLYGTLSRTGTAYAWLLVIVGTGLSVAGNIAAAPPDLAARFVHAGAPVVLALVLEGVLGPVRDRAGVPARRVRRIPPAPARRVQNPAGRGTLANALAARATSAAKATPARASGGRPSGKAAAVRALLTADPTLQVRDLDKQTGIDPSDARKIRRALTQEMTV